MTALSRLQRLEKRPNMPELTMSGRNGNKKKKSAKPYRFMSQFIRHPLTVGSVCPSSMALAKALFSRVPHEDIGLIIDLGAGTGSVSYGMLRAGVPRERIIAVEALPGFGEAFAERCPGVRFIEGKAEQLGAVLDREAPGRGISAIVSSLPFRVLGPKLGDAILREIQSVLRERGGLLIQYTYAWWLTYPLQKRGFEPASASIVWKNIPPARVESYKSLPV